MRGLLREHPNSWLTGVRTRCSSEVSHTISTTTENERSSDDPRPIWGPKIWGPNKNYFSQFTERYEVDLFNIDLLLEDDIKEIVSNVVGEGYRWVWLLTKTSVQKAHRKAVINLKYSAGRKGCNAVIGVTTNVTYFPGFLGFRGCSVFLTGTAVRI
jgi:uncharacterized protein YbjQ (UPF0145 family)